MDYFVDPRHTAVVADNSLVLLAGKLQQSCIFKFVHNFFISLPWDAVTLLRVSSSLGVHFCYPHCKLLYFALEFIKHCMVKGHIWVSNQKSVGSNPARSWSKNNERALLCLYGKPCTEKLSRESQWLFKVARLSAKHGLPFRQDSAMTPATFSFLIASNLSLCALLGIIFTDR